MVSMSKVFYFIKEALINFKRNWSTSLGAIITIFLSLLVIGVFMVGGLMVDKVVESVESKVSIQVFIADGATQADIDSLESDIRGLEYVQSVTFTTKEAGSDRLQGVHVLESSDHRSTRRH